MGGGGGEKPASLHVQDFRVWSQRGQMEGEGVGGLTRQERTMVFEEHLCTFKGNRGCRRLYNKSIGIETPRET
jgi:hypothetical protein